MPRSLAAAVQQDVDAQARRRGDAYFREHRVSLGQTSAGVVTATVRGTEDYTVTLRIDGEELLVSCSCPYLLDRLSPCKHVWAAIRAADEARALTPPSDLWVMVDDLTLSSLDPDTVVKTLTPSNQPRHARPPKSAPPAPWQRLLADVSVTPSITTPRPLLTGEIVYLVDLASTAAGLSIDVMLRDRKKSGDWSKPRPLAITRGEIGQLSNEEDREILQLLCGASDYYARPAGFPSALGLPVPSRCTLPPALQRLLTPRLCETGRLMLRTWLDPHNPGAGERLIPLAWDPDPAVFVLRVVSGGHGYTIDGVIRAGGRDRQLRETMFLTTTLVLWAAAAQGESPRFASFDPGAATPWLNQLMRQGPVFVPERAREMLIDALAVSDVVNVECPPELRVDRLEQRPQPMLRIAQPTPAPYSYRDDRERLEAKLTFIYGEVEADAWSGQATIVDRDRHVAWRRDIPVERAAIARLTSLGVRRLADWNTGGTRLDFAANQLPRLVRILLAEGWNIEADGQLYRRAASSSLRVQSGVDWFELHGAVDFGGASATLPALLAAARRGDPFVRLGDGTFGMLPEEWLARAGRIGAMGIAEGDHVRFARSQAALLDAWLADEPDVPIDAAFARARAEMARFDGIRPLMAPPTFRGELRGYQHDAMGWFDFLRRFGVGGCLADEMGLGKTVMVLAALEARRLEREQAGEPPRPSLLVVPRSLVFNWCQEAGRFVPQLRVLDYTGAARVNARAEIAAHDVVITTYGTLRRDAGHLKDLSFDYAILDEAQAIKNARTTAAKAAKLLKADHRLALSGTPIENHVGELWSLFDFLNPGMLGAESSLALGRPGQDPERLAFLARGLRPFILRRTKEQVAAELPARSEQTIYCDLEPAQRAMYDELRDHYRASLLGKISRLGLGRAKLQILEALLRLRQASCHPGLIDPARVGEGSAKLDVLVPRLQELAEEGRKVLVFSQFTSLLALVRTRLDAVPLEYEYLDGATRDRAARVRRFQEDNCPVFLISLKAGGLGLNLTAAEYVFLLDPWWNPAVEAQAIDRAHRIGQTRPVFAYRLIARATVEEKVLELQAAKRTLADAIVRADESLIRDLRREDLELLLG